MRLRHTHIRPRSIILGGLAVICVMALPAAASAAEGIEGTVTNGGSAAHEPIVGLNVCADKVGGSANGCMETDSNGKYALNNLGEVGEYTVRFTGEVCRNLAKGFTCEAVYVEKTVTVQVKSGSNEVANASLLEVDGKITGKVTAAGAPMNGAFVCAFGAGFGCVSTNAGGEYTIEHLPPGSYRVEFSAGATCKLICQPVANYIYQYYNNQLIYENATAVSVKTSETVTGINAELQPGGHIAGKVTNASIYAQPIANAVVCAVPIRTNKAGEREGESSCALTNASGEYSVQALASGGYEVELSGEVCVEEKGGSKCTHPYIHQYYQSIVSVSAPGTTSGINMGLTELAPVKPANTAPPTVTVAQTVKAGPETLTCSTGNWSGNPTTLSYRWLRNGSAIAGQSANTYTAQGADAGTGIACEVTVSNGAGSAASTSNTVQIPKPTPGVAVFKSASVKGATISVTLLCSGASACSGTVKIVARISAAHGKHKTTSTTIGSAHFSIELGKTATVKVHLTSKGSKLLSQAGKRGLKMQIAGSGVTAHTTTLKSSSKHH